MTEQFVIKFVSDAIYTALLVAGPILIVTLLVGLMVGIFQAVTSINEMTLTFSPKLIAVVVLMLVLLPWMLRVLTGFTLNVFHMIEMVAR